MSNSMMRKCKKSQQKKKPITWYKLTSFESLKALAKGTVQELIISCQGHKKEFYCSNSKSKFETKTNNCSSNSKQHNEQTMISLEECYTLFLTLSNTHSLVGWNPCGYHTLEMVSHKVVRPTWVSLNRRVNVGESVKKSVPSISHLFITLVW